MSSFYGGSGGGLSSEDLEAITSKIFKFEIVNALPENNISDSTIYLISTGEQEDNIYTEYVYINNHWEKFGTQKIDLTNYVTLEFFDEKLAAKQDNLTAGSNISITEVDGKFIISAVDTTYSNATPQTSGLMSPADKTKIDGITAAKMQAWDAAEQNVNADWTAESGDAQILHKPDLSVYALAANVTKSALGIDNVDNTSDANKPISTATQTALAGKAAASHAHDDRYYTETEIDNKLGGKSNTGHSHAQSDITGLDSALAGKAAASHTHAQSDITGLSDALSGKADANHNHSGVYAPASHTHTKSQITDLANVSASAAGLMSAADKKKLDKINIVVLTQAQYDAIASPDSNTLYLIPEASA